MLIDNVLFCLRFHISKSFFEGFVRYLMAYISDLSCNDEIKLCQHNHMASQPMRSRILLG
jgi:hypothetical protein